MKLYYKFKDKSLLELALTQRGINSRHNNERLEFVGDRVLGLSVSAMLYAMYPNENEGELARRFASLVSTETLADVARSFDLHKEVKHAHMTAGRTRHMLANAMEAVIGAIFFDGGFDNAQRFVCSIWHELAAAELRPPKDPKTMLQEFVQKYDNGSLPTYEDTEKVGEDHSPIFTVTVTAMGESASGDGPSKKAAGSAAAAALLKILESKKNDN
ncbi:MAG: ribonuclease III [Alphaproteobacteria bacterium]|nr:ribonuclease III [Alphaproteobacteria bacterium]